MKQATDSKADAMFEAVLDAERALIGCWLLSDRSVEETLELLEPEAFVSPAHRAIAEAIADVAKRGKQIDWVALKIRMTELGTLEAAGGVPYLITCAEMVPSPAHDLTYAQIVNTAAWKREKVESLKAAIEACSTDDADAIQQQLEHLASTSLITQAPVIEIQDVNIFTSHGDGIPTGYRGIDKLVSVGGFPRGQTSVVLAYHKAGKSSFMLTSAWDCANRDLRVLYATLKDLSAEDVKKRILKQLCGWDRPPIGMGKENANFTDALAELNDKFGAQFTVYDARRTPDARITQKLCAWVEARHQRQPYDIVFVDYAQNLRSKHKGSRYEQELDNCERISDLAADLNIPVVIGSQITLGGKDGVDASKGGRHWEEDAGLIFRLKRDDQLPKDDFGSCDAVIEMPHSRFAPLGKVEAFWNGKLLKYEEAA